MPEHLLPSLTPARAVELVSGFAEISVVVVGDVMLDQFIFGRVTRISPEAPVPVVEFDRDEFRLGGAGNVATNIRIMGGAVAVAGVVGCDEQGQRLVGLLEGGGVDARLVVDRDRPTTTKVRIVTSRHQQVARVDYEVDRQIDGETEGSLWSALEQPVRGADIVVVSDYLKGVITPALMTRVTGICRERSIPVLVDPKVEHLDYYCGATLITPNNFEAEAAAQMRIRSHADARRAARTIRDRLGCESVLMTRGESGMWLLSRQEEGYLQAVTREVADVTGAGDTVVAVLALALAAGATVVEAASLANVAAGISVTKFGPAAPTATELLSGFAASPRIAR